VSFYVELDKLKPYKGEILSLTMIETCYQRAAFVTESCKDQELLILHCWKEGKWYLETFFHSTGPGDIDVEPYAGHIRDICVGSCDKYPSLLVVEESAYIRWWHLYVDGGNEWIHSHS
jgi:hypothetical protein